MKNSDSTSLFSLFITFAKVGVMTFGGGMAMLPMLETECVDRHNWATKEEMLDIYAIGQCTPGIIAVNTATFMGYKRRGIIGGIVATCGIVFPSLVIIILLATVLNRFSSNVIIQKAFNGIRVSVCALMTSSLIKLGKKAINGFETALIAFISLVLELFLDFSPIFVVLLVIAYSLIVYFSFKKEAKI